MMGIGRMAASPEKKRALGTALTAVALVALAVFSEYLSIHRIYQVDEVETVFTTRILALHRTADFVASANLFMLGPLEWIAGATDHAATIFRTDRLIFFVVFWINLCLIVRCTGVRLRSQKGLLYLLLAATIAPLWDYGFEIRHDNVLLTCLLLAWSYARPLFEEERVNMFAVAALSVVAQFVAFKAFVYTIPIIVFALFNAFWVERRPPIRTFAQLMGGAALAFAACAAIHIAGGTWTFYSSDTKSLSHAVAEATHFSPAFLLERFEFFGAPLTVVALTAIVIAVINVRRFASRDSLLPEAAFILAALIALFVNPTPFPYNIILLAPQVAIIALRLGTLSYVAQPQRAFLASLFAVHLFFWGAATWRHVAMSNARQVLLMDTAEEMTSPTDRVFDGSGLVATRFPPGREWLIHTLTAANFRLNAPNPIRKQLDEGRTPIVIPNYRTSWLPVPDHRYIRDHYFALADDFYVAGTQLDQPETRTWDCPITGRYFIACEKAGTVTIDGVSRGEGVISLSKGAHAISFDRTRRAFLIWLGPTLSVPPSLGPGSWQRVFVNWY